MNSPIMGAELQWMANTSWEYEWNIISAKMVSTCAIGVYMEDGLSCRLSIFLTD